MIIEDLQELLGSDVSTNLLTIYIRKANTIITKYINNPLIVDLSVFDDAVIELVTLFYNKRGNEGVTSYSQGGVSGSYGEDLPQSVKSLLPLPYIQMR